MQKAPVTAAMGIGGRSFFLYISRFNFEFDLYCTCVISGSFDYNDSGSHVHVVFIAADIEILIEIQIPVAVLCNYVIAAWINSGSLRYLLSYIYLNYFANLITFQLLAGSVHVRMPLVTLEFLVASTGLTLSGFFSVFTALRSLWVRTECSTTL